MATKDNHSNDQVDPNTVLDDLICRYYEKILENIKKNPTSCKPGDLLKMIELKRKLTPEGTAQKELWDMLERIRQKNLGDNKTGRKASSPTKRTTKRKRYVAKSNSADAA